jgi:hypothetical protein
MLAIAAMIATTLLLYPRGHARSDAETIEAPKLTQQQEVWLSALQWCESRGRDDAINPKDRDGTASYGAFQFKPSTYAYFAKRYGLASTTDYMNAVQQREIVSRMLLDKSISDSQLRNQQFPDCIQHKVGLPPR